jgi:hypothetical protein
VTYYLNWTKNEDFRQDSLKLSRVAPDNIAQEMVNENLKEKGPEIFYQGTKVKSLYRGSPTS